MARYRKKPVEIEAVRVIAADYNGRDFDGSPFSEVPEWLEAAFRDNVVVISERSREFDYAVWDVKTLEGVMLATPDDFLIRGVKGEIYPCRHDIFEMTYEEVIDVQA